MNSDLHEAAQKLVRSCNCAASVLESYEAVDDYLEEYGRQGLIEAIRELCGQASTLRREARDLQRNLDADFLDAYQQQHSAQCERRSA